MAAEVTVVGFTGCTHGHTRMPNAGAQAHPTRAAILLLEPPGGMLSVAHVKAALWGAKA